LSNAAYGSADNGRPYQVGNALDSKGYDYQELLMVIRDLEDASKYEVVKRLSVQRREAISNQKETGPEADLLRNAAEKDYAYAVYEFMKAMHDMGFEADSYNPRMNSLDWTLTVENGEFSEEEILARTERAFAFLRTFKYRHWAYMFVRAQTDAGKTPIKLQLKHYLEHDMDLSGLIQVIDDTKRSLEEI